MNKKLKTIVLSVLFLVVGFAIVGCGANVTDAEVGTKVTAPTITNWYVYEEKDRLDTSVNIDFDQIKIDDIVSIKFIIYDNDTELGSAISENKNLETLFKDCEQYWNNTGDYKDTTGVRTLSCAFTKSDKAIDNGYWYRTACIATKPNVPTNLKVEVVVKKDDANNLRYTVNSNTK